MQILLDSLKGAMYSGLESEEAMNTTIRKNETHLIEVDSQGYAGDRGLFLTDAEVQLSASGLQLGDWNTSIVRIGKRSLLFAARPYISDEAAFAAEIEEEKQLAALDGEILNDDEAEMQAYLRRKRR